MNLLLFKALADDTRLAILEQLADGERCICDLASGLGASDALVSHHMKRLREAGLVRTRRGGVWLHCSIEPDTLDLLASELAELAARANASKDVPSACCTTPAPKASTPRGEAAR